MPQRRAVMKAACRRRREVLAVHPQAVQNPPMTIPPELLRQLAAAKSVAVLTGAGVSAESGVPTFRDAQTGLC
jgi:hypothetical protein